MRSLTIMMNGNVRCNIYSLLVIACLILSSCTSSDDDAVTTDTTVADQDEDSATATVNDSYVYKLPVIFHVLYSDKSDGTQYVSATRLKTILKYVNEIYQGGVYGQSEDINVDFELAEYDESGDKLSTPGVEYVKWTGSYPIDPTDFMSDNTGKNVKYIWDPNEYINVMMYNFKSEENDNGLILGVSHMPLTVEGDSALDGLEKVTATTIFKSALRYAYCSSINSTYVNSESSRYSLANKGANGYTYNSADIVVTLAHELGHYLGLHHVYAETRNDTAYVYADTCLDSDYCEDTPSYDRNEYKSFVEYYLKQHSSDTSIDISDLIKRTNCAGEEFNSTDIMDYSIGLGYNITPEQKQRIRHVLYYSPLIPGPKKNASSRSIEQGPQDLPMTIVK